MKRIIPSSVMLLAVAAVVVGSTGAFFTDTETSTGNVFTAGSIDLKVNHTAQTYNGVSCQTCSVTVFSSTNTKVIGANAAASNQGPFPFSASEVTNPNPAWLNEGTLAPAQWIWIAPAVVAADTTNNAEYTFEDTFFLQGPIALSDFDLEIASDNGYKIVVNGITIVDRLTDEFTYTGLNPLTGPQQAAFQAALIQNGQNSLQITVRNKAGNANPNSNPAGLLYKITFENEDCVAGVADFQQTCELWRATDLTTERFFNFSDVKPQDRGTNLISMLVDSNESYLCLAFNDTEEQENNVIAPETAAGDVTPGLLEGELGEFLTVAGWYSNEDGDKGALLFGPTAAADLDAIAFADSETAVGPVPPGVTQYVQLEWCLGDMEVDGTTVTCDGVVPNINQAQTDAFLADLQFYAVQSRNNAEFTCANAVFGDDEPVLLP
jgi:predicted ribosomally synthesized peptide with SipW-like signal peptide